MLKNVSLQNFTIKRTALVRARSRLYLVNTAETRHIYSTRRVFRDTQRALWKPFDSVFFPCTLCISMPCANATYLITIYTRVTTFQSLTLRSYQVIAIPLILIPFRNYYHRSCCRYYFILKVNFLRNEHYPSVSIFIEIHFTRFLLEDKFIGQCHHINGKPTIISKLVKNESIIIDYNLLLRKFHQVILLLLL